MVTVKKNGSETSDCEDMEPEFVGHHILKKTKQCALVAIVNQTAQKLQILKLRRALSKTSVASSSEDANEIQREMATQTTSTSQ